jgi:hypothetical protein
MAECQESYTYNSSSNIMGMRAEKQCGEYYYESCPAGCTVGTYCPCPPHQYSTSTGLCVDKIFNVKTDAIFAQAYDCIGTAGSYPSCPSGYGRLNQVNTDSWSDGNCSLWRWKDPKFTLCVKYTYTNRKVGEACLKTVTHYAC